MNPAAGTYAQIIFPDTTATDGASLTGLRKAMLDATPDCIKMLTVGGALLAMNSAGCQALGVPANSDFGMDWLSLLPADVRGVGRLALEQAATGQSARFPGQSQAGSHAIYWDNLLTPIVDDMGEVVMILCVSRDVTEKTLLERKLGEAIEREKLLSREVQRRVKTYSR